MNYGDNIIFTSWEQGTSSLLLQVPTIDRQILIIQYFVMALPCQCSCISSATLLSYFGPLLVFITITQTLVLVKDAHRS